jgi:signal transduction histidine kinase
VNLDLVTEFGHLNTVLRRCLKTLPPALPIVSLGFWLKQEEILFCETLDRAITLPKTARVSDPALFELAWENPGSVIVDASSSEGGYHDELGPATSLFLKPISGHDGPLGTLILALEEPLNTPELDRELLEAVADQIANSLLSAQDYLQLQSRYGELDESYRKSLQKAAKRLEQSKELNQRNEELETQIDQVYKLETIGQTINRLHDEARIIEHVAQSIVSEMDLERGAILWINGNGSRLLCRASFSQRGADASDWSIDAHDSLLAPVLHESRPLYISDETTDKLRQSSLWAHFAVTSLIAHPLAIGQERKGVLLAGAKFPYSRLFAKDIRTIAFLASQTEQAIENAQLYQRLRETNITLEQRVSQRTAELATVNEISQIVNSTLDLDQVLDHVMSQISESFAVERASLLLLDEASNQLSFATNLGGDLEALQSFPLQLGKGIAGWVAEKGDPAIVLDPDDDPRFFPDVSKSLGFEVNSILCVPLAIKGRIIGVIELLNKLDGDFDEADAERLQTLSAPIAIAIDNAQLFGATQRQAAERLALYQVGRDLRSLREWVKSPENVLSPALEIVGQANVRYQTVGLYTFEDQKVTLQASYGYPADTAIPSAPPAQRAQRLRHTSQATVISDLPAAAYAPLRADSASAAILPLFNWQGTHIGSILVESDKMLSQNDLALLQAFAEQIAVALDNASLYKELKAANAHLLELNDARIDFVSSVSHELRTPMTSIKGYTDMLLSGMTGELTEPQRRFLSIIESNANRLGILVNDLLEVSRLEAGRIHLERKAVSVNEVVLETTTGLQGKMVSKRLGYETRIPASLPSVWGDPDRLIQILTNLLSNACKYTPEGGRITVQARPVPAQGETPAQVRIDVADTGIGIAEEEQSQIFQRFFRADHDMVREQVGTGLGLSIVKGLVELHQGEIWFTSELDEGTTFSFTIPIASETAHQADTDSTETSSA